MPSPSKESAKFLAMPSLLKPAVTVNVSSKTISMGGGMAITNVSIEAQADAIEQFLKENVELGRQLLRSTILRNNLYVKNISMMTVRTTKTTVPIKLEYSKERIPADKRLKLVSFYIGKRNDTIFTFSFQEDGATNKLIEAKLRDAVHLISGFFDQIDGIFGHKVGTMAAHNQMLKDKKDKELKDAAALKVKQKADANAAMYANKPFGVW